VQKNRTKFLLILAILIFAISVSGYAQSNELIDELLAEKQAAFGKIAYMGLAAAGLIPAEATIEESLAFLQTKDWNITDKGANDAVNIGEYSYLLMKAFNIPGGIMYSISPGGRYACRELTYLGFIKGNNSPYRTLSGEEVLRILSNMLNWLEERQ